MKDLKYDEKGLIPAIVQDAGTLEVLTLAYMNEESLARTIQTGQTWFWSRSRNALWHKGETSGNLQEVVDLIFDCDRDAIVVLVKTAGPACHTGATSCFHNPLAVQSPKSKVQSPETPEGNLGTLLDQLYQLLETRRIERPAGSYTSYLFNEGLDKILKKVGEESAETIIAAKNVDTRQLTSEVSDLLYHLLVMLVERNVSLDEIRQELARRRKDGGRE
jgi:phosphoribosyl-ATP pyrophosphohydrolase/phosphoribosyl-AMP cyclohydrolase